MDEVLSAEHQLVLNLERLIEVRFRRMALPRFYARACGLSLPVLNKVCVKHRGMPVSALISLRVIREARFLLSATTLPAASIAYELGFKDPSYFCRYFKRLTGMTVLEYRRRS